LLVCTVMANKSVGVFSTYTLEMISDSGTSNAAVLKRGAILFDGFLFHPQGVPVGMKSSDFPGWLTDKGEFLSIFASKDSNERTFLAHSREFRNLFELTDEASGNAERFYRSVRDRFNGNMALRSAVYEMAQEEVDRATTKTIQEKRNAWDFAKRLIGQLSEDFGLFDAVHETNPSAIGLFSDLHRRVLARAAQSSAGGPHGPYDFVLQSKALPFPDFGQLPWKSILELRKNSYLGDFRDKLAEFAAKKATYEDVDESLLSDLWKIAGLARHDLKRAYFSALLGNVPLPMILPNPIGIAASAGDIRKQRRLSKFGWVFFIAETGRLIQALN